LSDGPHAAGLPAPRRHRPDGRLSLAATNWHKTIDLSATSLTASAYEYTDGNNNDYSGTGPLFCIVLGDLNLGSGITGLCLLSGGSTWSNSLFGTRAVVTATTNAQCIAIDWYALDFGASNDSPDGGSWTWNILYAGATTGPGGENQAVPEPASAALLLAGIAGTAVFRRRKED
jgi:hypothetical protein